MVAYYQLNQALEPLAAQLEAKGKRRELVVIGGSGTDHLEGKWLNAEPSRGLLEFGLPEGFHSRLHGPNARPFRSFSGRAVASPRLSGGD